MVFTTLDIFICLIQLISFIIYSMVIVFLIFLIYRGNRDTSTEFYIHFIVNGFVDILSNIFDILIRRLLVWGLYHEFFESYLWVGNLSPIIYYSTVANCEIGTVIITFNRYMQMHYPLKYKIFWTKRVTIIMVLLQIITPYLSYIYLVNYKVTLLYSEEKHYYYHSMIDKTASWNNSFIMCIWSGSTFLLAFFMNIFNIKKYIQIVLKNKNNSKSLSSKIYLYSMYCLLISISLLLVFLNSCIKLYAVINNLKSLKEQASNNYEWIILLMTCCHPFLILILSKELRRKFLTFYSIHNTLKVTPLALNTINNSKSHNRTVRKV
uniref:G-protein coupled receptors family 1 profile domain-containing protein n=1 Tax=Strongyloides stercoralis TaxID=6248 RepID=A0A0K0E4U2_STRER